MKSEEFNKKYPIGTKIKYFSIYGIPKFKLGITTTPAWELGHGTSCVTTNLMGGGLIFRNLEVFEEKSGTYKKLIIKKPRRELNRQKKKDEEFNKKTDYFKKLSGSL